MRQRTYLNVILTVNAVLLAGLLWTALAGTPLLAPEATAQVRTKPPVVPTLPNAADQRHQMVAALRDMKRSVDSLEELIASGRMRVRVTNLDDVVVKVEK